VNRVPLQPFKLYQPLDICWPQIIKLHNGYRSTTRPTSTDTQNTKHRGVEKRPAATHWWKPKAWLKYLSLKVYLPLMVVCLFPWFVSESRLIIIWLIQNHLHDNDSNNDGDNKNIKAPLFTCQHNGRPIELHAHALAEDVIYHIGWEAFTTKGSHNLHLTDDAAKHWNSLAKPAARKTLAKLPALKIPGGKMSK